MANFRYAPIPREVLCNPSLSWTMKGRYSLLLGKAFNREVLSGSLESIAELWSEAEGTQIDPESVGWYLGQMAKAGLIRREQTGRYNWVTRLLKRYVGGKSQPCSTEEQSQSSYKAATVAAQPQPTSPPLETLSPSKGLRPEESPGPEALITNQQGIAVDAVDDMWFQIDKLQQQQLLVFRLLINVGDGILPQTALEFALTRPWGVVRDWVCYALDRETIRDPAGFVVTMLGQNATPPFPPRPGSAKAARYRSILLDLGVTEGQLGNDKNLVGGCGGKLNERR